MNERGKIRNRAYAQQLRDFTGLRWGNITPTDIDGFIDFGGKLFVYLEGKHQGASMPRGQELALERICDSHKVPTVIISVSHDTQGDINYAQCPVTRYRWQGKWHIPKRDWMAREFIDEFLTLRGLYG